MFMMVNTPIHIGFIEFVLAFEQFNCFARFLPVDFMPVALVSTIHLYQWHCCSILIEI